ncbi:hypothetical protein MUP79_03090 [Candidatus Bathyarchaeota archaeon]|nr:hypothetical protein [Candidatus Bathyarchaeota archaeon]
MKRRHRRSGYTRRSKDDRIRMIAKTLREAPGRQLTTGEIRKTTKLTWSSLSDALKEMIAQRGIVATIDDQTLKRCKALTPLYRLVNNVYWSKKEKQEKDQEVVYDVAFDGSKITEVKAHRPVRVRRRIGKNPAVTGEALKDNIQFRQIKNPKIKIS